MSRAVTCPVCREGTVLCTIQPGEPAQMYDRNGDGYPGWPPSLEEIDPSCECYDSGLVQQDAYWRVVEEQALAGGVDMEDDGDAAYEARRDA